MRSATPSRAPASRTMTIARRWTAARDVHVLELAATDGQPLPPAEPGAHIDLHLPGGIVRQYSLLNAEQEPERYRVGVLRDPQSRGGSACVADALPAGSQLRITGPRNHFVLDESASQYTLIAGGIGVTPLLAMARRLKQLGRPCAFHYLLRTRERAAFLDELDTLLAPGELHVHIDAEGTAANIEDIVGAAATERQLYACGPTGLLDAITSATEAWSSDSVHFERFAAPAVSPATAASPATIELRRSGLSFELAADETLLHALHRHGVDVPCACEEGVCGSCAVDVVEGAVDHRDSLQDDDEKAENRVMFTCVSRPSGPHLVLDL